MPVVVALAGYLVVLAVRVDFEAENQPTRPSSMHVVTKDLERLLVDYPPDVGELTLKVREAILAAMPDAAEKVYFGWRGIGFHHPAAGYVCGIFPGQEEVKIGFERGKLLHDPDQVLVGNGKRVRYLRLSAWDPTVPEALGRLLDQAVQLR